MPVLFLIAIAVVLAGIVFAATGRGGELAYEHADHAPLDLGPVSAADVALLRPPTAMWGYNMQVTDEALDQIARAMRERDMTIAHLQEQLATVERDGSYAEPGGVHARQARYAPDVPPLSVPAQLAGNDTPTESRQITEPSGIPGFSELFTGAGTPEPDDAPAVTDAAEVADTPETPRTRVPPYVPWAPDAPQAPKASSVPTDPEIPANPRAPADPGIPTSPGIPPVPTAPPVPTVAVPPEQPPRSPEQPPSLPEQPPSLPRTPLILRASAPKAPPPPEPHEATQPSEILSDSEPHEATQPSATLPPDDQQGPQGSFDAHGWWAEQQEAARAEREMGAGAAQDEDPLAAAEEQAW